MQAKLIEIKNLWDSHGCSQAMHDDLLYMLFSKLEQNNDHAQAREHTFEDVFQAMPATWKRDLTGYNIPTS
jgi:hypothetical protein